jgi:1-acyl-sn-glycerol-3-phosphate acyltransferase
MKGMHAILKVVLFIYTRLFSIRSNISPKVKELNAPYLLVSNHIGTWDPFVVGYFLSQPIHFVSSDAVFRDRFMRMLLIRMGVIPKKKNIKDTKVVRTMLSTIKNNNCIGLFPEASRSWTGRTMHIDPSTAKLIKLLNVPVVTAKMKGMQLFNPRWASLLRKTKVIIDFELSLSKDDVAKLSESEIYEKIKRELFHDEVAYQRKHLIKVFSFHRAEYISYVLFICPECHSIGKITNHRNNFECSDCASKWHINTFSFFEGIGHQSKFDNIIDWYDWQFEYFESFIKQKAEASNSAILFSDKNMLVFQENGNGFKRVGKCDMNFFIDRIELNFYNGKQMLLPIKEIQTLSPQLRERIEMTYDDKAYRILSRKKGVSGLKWELACNSIWKNEGQEYKRSSYFK